MTLYYIDIKSNRRRYYIESEKGKIAWFDDLDTAAVVLRYLKGDTLTKEEIAQAHRAMKAFDTHQKEGKYRDTKPTAGAAGTTDTTE